MSSGSCNPELRGWVCPLLKEALAKKYVPDTGLREYPVGWEERMEVGPLPEGKGKRTMGNCACKTSPSRAKLMVALG